MTSIKPVYYKANEYQGFLNNLSTDISNALGKDADLLLDYPAVYVHVWQSKNDLLNGTYSIYIGESNDVVERTKEHWNASKIRGQWQNHWCTDKDINGKTVVPTVYYFGHQFFNKSMTLDIENRLIDYCYAMPTAHIYNGRTNPQNCYAGCEYTDTIFSMIWEILRNDNKTLFMSRTEVQRSAIYKTSPNHKLTVEQKEAQSIIIDRVVDAVLADKMGQLIFIEGEAGTGKTVLTSSTFYKLLENDLLKSLKLKSCLLINHQEQKNVYENMARRLGYDEKSIVQHPTTFLIHNSIVDKTTNSYEPNPNNIFDVVFVDEAHLLWHQRNQKFDNRFRYPQLEEILRRARVTIIMYDENQVLHRGQICSHTYMLKMRELAKNQGPDVKNGKTNYYVLNNQLRMNCSKETINWIDDITKKFIISHISLNKSGTDSKGYQVKIYDDPALMHQDIVSCSKKPDSVLSRVVATCDWPFISSKPTSPQYVVIGNWKILWNEETYNRFLYDELNKRETKKLKMLDWAEKDYSINEAGSTFTVQGFDLSYVGVIIGPSIKYDNKKKRIFVDKKFRKQNYMVGSRVLDDGSVVDVTEVISKNELRVLMTRGTKGLFIYACDDDLRKALKDSLT
ncbi:MAG: DUF2075 domain-containing protein [Lachnospiraceae bacterium]|nr:DUF2075 domain-containing protein [Lachnospiraceae bacterium]